MRQVLPLRDYRLARGWSLDDVAKRLAELGRQCGEDNLGVNGLMVGRWERGERRPAPPYPKLLCLLYQATTAELLLAPSPRMGGAEGVTPARGSGCARWLHEGNVRTTYFRYANWA